MARTTAARNEQRTDCIARMWSTTAAISFALCTSLAWMVPTTVHAQSAACLDIDGNGAVETNDLLLIARYHLGFAGPALLDNALGANPTRSTETDVVNFIQSRNYDVDGNGFVQLNDIVILGRYMAGVTGSALTANALSSGAARTTEIDVLTYINRGCQNSFAQAVAAPRLRLASNAVLANLVEIKVQHGGQGQVVVRGDMRSDSTMSVGGLTLIQPINNTLSTIAVWVDTTFVENGHTIFGVRTAKLDDVFSSIDVNLSSTLTEGQTVTKRAVAGVAYYLEDANGNRTPIAAASKGGVDDQAKAGVWFPRDNNSNGFNVDTTVVRTTAPSGSVGYSKLIIEAKDAVVWDADGDISSPAQGPQLLLNGKIGLEDARIDVIIDWPSVLAPPNKLGAKTSGTWVSDLSLKLTGGSLSFSVADFAGLDDKDAKASELDLGVAKIKGVKFDDGRINIGSIAWNATANTINVAGFNQVISIPVGVVISFYLGLDGSISAAAEVGYSYSAYIEKGGIYDFTTQSWTPFDVVASGAFPNPNKPGNPSPTPADYASKPAPNYTAKLSGTLSAIATAGIEVGVATLGIIPVVVDNKVKEEVNISGSLGVGSTTGWYGCLSGTSQLTLESKFRINAEITAKKSWSWLSGSGSAGFGYEKVLGTWSPGAVQFGGSLGDCTNEIAADYAYTFVGTAANGGLTTNLAAVASVQDGVVSRYQWYINERPATNAVGAVLEGQNIIVDLAPGLNDIGLRVTDNANRIKDVRKAVRVAALPVPVALYGWYPKDNKAGEVVRFDPSPSKAADNLGTQVALMSYQWNFGDGSPLVTVASSAVQAKAFAAAGSYPVTLTITDANGLKSTYSRLIWIGTQPAVSSSTATLKLNDTGIMFSGDAPSGNSASCLPTDPAGQDCRYGRDAAAQAGTITKVGGSSLSPTGFANGFDYTKISNSGGVLPDTAALGSGANDWACTRDNVTGLIWEVKTTGGLRSMSDTYTWYFTGSPDGNNGIATSGSCQTTGRCDTEKFAADVNATELCGYSDWRVPMVKELEGIADLGRASPAIDTTYFPNTPNSYFWSASPYASGASQAWGVSSLGHANVPYRTQSLAVRVVRGGR